MTDMTAMTQQTDNSFLGTSYIEFEGKEYVITFSIETITSGRALNLLSSKVLNRHETPAHQDRIAQAMMSNEFVTLLDPIRISNTGKLIDGNHRLGAIANTGKAQKLLVLKGFPETIYKYIDQGQARTLKDTFQSDGRANPDKIATVSKFLYQMLISEKDKITRIKPSNPVGLNILKAHRGLEESVKISLKVVGPKGINAPLNVVAICHYLWSQENSDLVTSFFDEMVNGPFHDEHHPPVKLHFRLRKIAREVKKASTSHRWDAEAILGLFVQSWIHYKDQKPLKKYVGEAQRPIYIRQIIAEAKAVDAKLPHGLHNQYMQKSFND